MGVVGSAAQKLNLPLSSLPQSRPAEDLDALVAAIEGDGPLPPRPKPQLSAAERYGGVANGPTKQRQQLSK